MGASVARGSKELGVQMEILIVEDEEDIRQALQDILADEGYRTPWRGTASSRWRFFELAVDLPRLILPDPLMPEMDGWSFWRASTKMPACTPSRWLYDAREHPAGARQTSRRRTPHATALSEAAEFAAPPGYGSPLLPRRIRQSCRCIRWRRRRTVVAARGAHGEIRSAAALITVNWSTREP